VTIIEIRPFRNDWQEWRGKAQVGVPHSLA